jgi:hypothetical protein
MKKTNQPTRTKLRFATETVRSLKLLSPKELDDVHGGHTSFSCGNNLCTTHLN